LEEYKKIYNFICEFWKDSVRHEIEDKGNLIGLPFPYTVPCPDGKVMQNMFYWDLYFINIGLIRQGFVDLAKNNVDNLLYLVQRYGYIPNGNRTFFLNRSQPPFLSLMIRDVFEVTKDSNWLAESFSIWKKEYDFWFQNRRTPTGLSRHLNHSTDKELLKFYENELAYRIKFNPENENDKIKIASHYLSEAETGWDFTPRFHQRAADFIQIELNCILYLCEQNAALFAKRVKTEETEIWRDRAEKRKKLILKILWNESESFFYDYDFINNTHSQVATLGGFAPLWANIVNKDQAEKVVQNVHRFEYDFGVAVCEKTNQKNIYQWDFPNGWPPITYFAIDGLINYGFFDDATRIAEKYLKTVTKNFESTGKIWEKYNVVDGSINVNNEYEMPSMLGWTAGVYVYCYDLIMTHKEIAC
jgi:alpha,alpha-trehalase